MLSSLTVRNFTIVEHQDVELRPGMTAITGETGAGKSLVVDALAMALGDRADTDRIRPGADKWEVTAAFVVEDNPLATIWLADNDFDQDGECLLRRTFTREGRSRGFINGQPATMQQLQQLGELMIDIHSQHEHQSLLKRETHRRLLDAFAGCEKLASEVDTHYRSWRQTADKLQDLESRSEEAEARRDLLRFQVEELDALALEDNEIQALEREQQLLANAEQVLRDSHAVLALCRDSDGDGDALAFVGQSLQLLDAMPEGSAALAEARDMLESARIQIDEAARAIQRHIDGFDPDPGRLAAVEERLSTAYQLARKHRVDPQGLVALHRQLREELDSLAAGEGGIEALHKTLDEQQQRLAAVADKLSRQRQKGARALAEAVNGQLASLAMGTADFRVKLSPLEQPGPLGGETVEFEISTNPGQPHKALARVASGGELSRISLAIQVVACQHTDIPTLVFDEVDVGVGGAVAEVVGRLLRELGNRGQVICVTHLAQVASCAHRHLVVSKSSDGSSVASDLVELDDNRRVEEIARMLGGSRITAQTRAHAEEMLTHASE